MQTIVGGYIEMRGRKQRMVINERGKLKNLPLNYLATRLYKVRASLIVARAGRLTEIDALTKTLAFGLLLSFQWQGKKWAR